MVFDLNELFMRPLRVARWSAAWLPHVGETGRGCVRFSETASGSMRQDTGDSWVSLTFFIRTHVVRRGSHSWHESRYAVLESTARNGVGAGDSYDPVRVRAGVHP
jgi:hypothetical protein